MIPSTAYAIWHFLAFFFFFNHTLKCCRTRPASCLSICPTSSTQCAECDQSSRLLIKQKDQYRCPTINANEILKDFKVEGLLCVKQEKFLKEEMSKERIFAGRFQRGCSLCAGNGMSRGCFTAQYVKLPETETDA